MTSAAASPTPPRPLPPGILSRLPWLTFLLPFLVFMLVGSLEPAPPRDDVPNQAWFEYRAYPVIYTVKIALTLGAMWLVWPGYRTFPFRASGLAIAMGIVGGVVWIALCELRLETKLGELLATALRGAPILERWSEYLGLGTGETGVRSAFNPLVELAATPAWAYGFLAIRFAGLVAIVAVIEEFFLRGFLIRYCVDPAFWAVPIGAANRTALAAGTLVPMLMHPGEWIAALVWFSAITWLMLRTRNIWDCVVAHALTNLVLCIYLVATGA